MSLGNTDTSWDEFAFIRTSEDAWSAFIQSRFAPLATRKLNVGPSVRSRMIAQEFRMFQKYWRIASQYRNATHGAAALPAEVLSTIFALAQKGWHPHRYVQEGSKTCFDLGWVNVTRVCSYWRRTALSTPALWTKIACPHLPTWMLADIVRRAGKLPLRLLVDTGAFHRGGVPVGSYLCEPIMKRSESVCINSRDLDETSAALRTLWPSRFTLTELIVDLDISECDGWCQLEPDKGVYNLSGFTALRRVSLRGCYPEWETVLPFPSSVTHLHLAIDYVESLTGTPYRTDAPRFKDVLASLPQLQELALRNFLPVPAWVDDEPFGETLPLPEPYHIPHLRKLSVICDCRGSYSDDYKYFWNNFCVPRMTVVKVHLALGSPMDDGAFLLPITCTNALDDAYHPVEMMLSQHTVSVHYRESKEHSWTRRTDVETHRMPPDPDRSYQSINENWDTDTTHGSRHVHDADTDVLKFIDTITLSSLRAVYIAANTQALEHEPGDWIRLFSTAQDVRRLSCSYPASFELFVALSRLTDDGRSPALFPHLDTLILHADFNEALLGSKQPHGSSIELALLDLLSTRMSCDAPIKRILVNRRLAMCNVWVHVDRSTTSLSFF
ncbi:unnamed protein product [Peniophora sp. CBMAI 1063]|nr:unnamed protein product [Peniophora sp. CBMAI 1063]